MSCKFKVLLTGDPNHPACRVTCGECQFITEDDGCPILAAFRGLEPNGEQQKSK